MRKSYRVVLLREAFEDIDRIIDYIKEYSPANAAKVLNRLWDASQSLEILPHRYEVYRSYRDRNRVVHSMAVPPFIVYYRILEQHQTVEVMTIRHGSRRQPRNFHR
ncbi:MAG TPA: type II toxin-antitoxin system RelE/ParE family toxin [Tepidisphaeraceae bacterium]|nr:type II toxin-antitoxin system RelE/ParE family toxin [Tepidisphaeraceae bacterium]